MFVLHFGLLDAARRGKWLQSSRRRNDDTGACKTPLGLARPQKPPAHRLDARILPARATSEWMCLALVRR